MKTEQIMIGIANKTGKCYFCGREDVWVVFKSRYNPVRALFVPKNILSRG